MSNNFYVGQEVVCINDQNKWIDDDTFEESTGPLFGDICTIRGINLAPNNEVHLKFVEWPGDNDEFVCRTVHIVAPADGAMTINVVPTQSGASGGLEITGRGSAYRCCALTASVPVTAGTEVIANVGMWWTSTVSQSFVLSTSPVRP